MSTTGNQALVFGASGLLGWSCVDQLLSQYPKAATFATVTAVMNRPIAESEFHWPRPSPNRPKLQLAGGIDLQHGTADDLAAQLRGKVKGIDNVTHAFYFVFRQVDDSILEAKTNCGMMQRVIDALNILAPKLKSFVYSGGTRGYGIYIPGGTFQAPLVEAMADSLPEEYAKTVAYPWFRKLLTESSKGRKWTWTEVCPDVVVGFTPNGSGYSLALHWAQYLSLYAYKHGIRDSSPEDGMKVEIPFPGNEGGFDALFTSVSSHSLGRIAIHAALNPDACGGKIINMLDRGRPSTFRDLWPALAGWFGLVGVGPASPDDKVTKPGEYVALHRHVFEESGLPKAVSSGVGVGSTQLDSVGWWLNFDRQLSDERLKASGFAEEIDPVDGWLQAFEKFRVAGIIL